MAPALTKILKDGHGIHLSSPLAADSRVMRSAESQMRSTEDGDLQKMWMNLSSFPLLDTCLLPSPLDVPADPALSPFLQPSAGQCEMLLLPAPGSLLSLLSLNKGLGDSHQVGSVFPGVLDMFMVPVPEHNSQEACLQHGHGAAPLCRPDGVDHSSLTFTNTTPSYTHSGVKSQGYTPCFAPLHASQRDMGGISCLPLASVGPSGVQLNPEQPGSRAALQERLSRQAGLQGRARTLQRRLQALLGEHALLHCSQQLEGLNRYCQTGGVCHDGLDSLQLGVSSPQAGSELNLSRPESSTASCSFTELREFSLSSQAVLRGLQEALDSEATGSSSSDEEQTEDTFHRETKTSPVSSSSCERKWLEERAELGSRWSWLQLRLAELEGRIQQLVELHKRIRSSKGGVVLAEFQPLTKAALSCTASDADTETCSPTRLLRNIERQSAQLSQIVNSLMPPLHFSPPSKQAQTWKGKRAFTSGHRGDKVFLQRSSKRSRAGSDLSCVCARTRPLLTYNKPKLFICNPSSPQDSVTSTSTLSSFSSSSCSCCSSCDPVVLCSDPDCSSSRTLSSRTPGSRPDSMLLLSFDTPLSHHFQRALAREEWSQKSLTPQPSTPVHHHRCSSTPIQSSHKLKQHAGRHKSRLMGLSPIRLAGSARSQHSRNNKRKRKRRRIHGLIEDADVLYQLCDQEESLDEILEESYVQVSRKQSSQGFVRKRQGESVYNINNIVIPMSLAKVEKLQYKDIITPSWWVVDSQSLIKRKAEEAEDDDDEGQMELLTDEVFAQRHLALEQREKLRRSSWGKRKGCRRPTRSGSRLSGSGGGMCTSGEESSVEWSCAQLDTDEQSSSEEWLPQTPWEPRMFPLDDEEEALLCDDLVLHCPLVEKTSAVHPSAAE